MASVATERPSTVQTCRRTTFTGKPGVVGQPPKHSHHGFQQPPIGSSTISRSTAPTCVKGMEAEPVIAKHFATSSLQAVATGIGAGMPGTAIPDANGSSVGGAAKQGRLSLAIAGPGNRYVKSSAGSSTGAPVTPAMSAAAAAAASAIASPLTSHGPPTKASRQRPTLTLPESHNCSADRLNHLQSIVRPLPDTPAPTSNDIFISYRHSDAEIMGQLKEVLLKNGFSVWVDECSINVGAAFIGKIGEGIINSKIFMCLVTESTYASRYCTDELCLAYIKEKPIYAVSLKPQTDMFAHIPTSIKLLVSRFIWTTASEENFQETIESQLIGKLRAELEVLRSPRLPVAKAAPTVVAESADGCWLDFWVKRFFTESRVEWDRFENAFFEEYGELLKEIYDPAEKQWFMAILKRELGADGGQLLREKYREFITDDEGAELNIFTCVADLLRENVAMREVFNLSSTVRINAINDLATFHSQAVIELLLDMLNDPEQDVRAAACLSLAKVPGGFESMKIDRLRHCLTDGDRFVRQAACVALGYLKANVAVADLLKIWRNDHIAEVRYEAQNALHAIGGDAVQSSIKTTNMLVKEIEELSKRLRERSRPQNGYALHKATYEQESASSCYRRHY